MPDYFHRLKAPTGDTDVLFVTDAQARIEGHDQKRFLGWKQTAERPRRAQFVVTTLHV